MLALILVISATFLFQLTDVGWTLAQGMLVPAEVMAAGKDLREGEFDLRPLSTLVSHAFLHGDFGHLGMNMLMLWIFAALAAELIGQRWMLMVFFFTAICGGLCHTFLNPEETIPMLGASGAVMGFEGLYLGMAVRWQLPDPHIWPMARPIPPGQLALLGIMGLIFDLSGFVSGIENIAYGAHLGGFIGGLVLGAVIVPKPRLAHSR